MPSEFHFLDPEWFLALIPLDLDNFLFDGWESGLTQTLRSRLVANFTGWETNSDVFDQQIYLRVVGLSHDLMGPQTLTSIDAAQATTAALTIIGVSESAANEAAQSCAGAIFYDDEEPLPLLPQPPFRP